MVSIIECLLRNCFENELEDQDLDESGSPSNSILMTIRRSVMNRDTFGGFYSQQSDYDLESNSIQLEESSEGRGNQNLLEDDRESENISSHASDLNPPQEAQSSLFSYFRRFNIGNPKKNTTNDDESESKSRMNPLEQEGEGHHPLIQQEGATSLLHNINLNEREHRTEKLKKNKLHNDHKSNSMSAKPILYEALTFAYDSQDKMIKIPSLPTNSIIMPGSEMQKQMALTLSNSSQNVDFEPNEDECVICLDTFTYENPKMPTICGCGENKTCFHLPCLYQWIEKNENCPSCRKLLRWEEFK